MSLFPVLSRFAAQSEQFDHYLKLSYRSMMAVAFGVCALVSPLAGPIIHLLYGAKFAEAGPLLAALIWSEVPVFFGVVATNAIVARNLQGYLPFCTGAGAIVNVALNLLLIPRWGALGSAWATNISYSVAVIFLPLAFAPTRLMTWVGMRISIAPFLLSALIAGALLVRPLPVAYELPIIILSYVLGAWLTGAVRRSEIERMRQLLGKSFAFVRPDAG
jgi:O-antigen/teichoic acid export membrane protein